MTIFLLTETNIDNSSTILCAYSCYRECLERLHRMISGENYIKICALNFSAGRHTDTYSEITEDEGTTVRRYKITTLIMEEN